MNFLRKAITLLPSFIKYLRGVMWFHERQYEAAIRAFEGCMEHPSLNNDMVFSYYGQALCALERLKEASPYLIKACQLYSMQGWKFKSKVDYNLAKNTIAALKHIDKHTDIEIDRSVFDAELRLNE